MEKYTIQNKILFKRIINVISLISNSETLTEQKKKSKLMQKLFHLHVASQFHEPLCILFRAVPLRKLDPEELQGTFKVCQKQVILRRLEREIELCGEKVLCFKAAKKHFIIPAAF